MNAETPGKLIKFQRYRARKKAAGYKQVRLWVRDPTTPEFKAEMDAMARHLRESKEEQDILAFAQALTDEALRDLPPY